MKRTRIKICGLKKVEEVNLAAQKGADAIGLNHYGQSPRYVDLDKAHYLSSHTPIFVDVVSVVANATESEISAIIERVTPRYIQFHGEESSAFCDQFDYPYIRAVRVRLKDDIEQAFDNYKNASALLLDTYDPKLYGGAGESFDWSLIPDALRHRIILAGGLNSQNVTAAIARVQPLAVDVSSGVESEKGIKDATKIIAFIDAVNATLNE